MIRNLTVSVLVFACYCNADAQKHTGARTPSSSVNDVQLFSHKHTIAAAYPFALQKKGELQQQSSSGTFFSAGIQQHRLHGKWQSRYANGQLIDEGTLVKGIPHGGWKVWNQNGTLLAIRHYDADLLQRIKQEIQINHPRNYFYTVTDLYKKKGPQVISYLKANYSFGTTSLVQPMAIAEVVDNNANDITRYHPVFTDCLHHGLYMNFYNNGHVKDSGYYYQGLKEGVWIHSTNNGAEVWKGSYKHGMPRQEWKLYNAAGKLMLIVFYSNNGKELWRKQL
jgi:antitoxin component YwqK of YwqJK toxin-antitoxin module